MSCAHHSEALLSDAAKLDAQTKAHLADCAACRAVRESHLAAAQLCREPVPSIAPSDYLAAVQRRRTGRVAMGTAAVAALAGIALWTAGIEEPTGAQAPAFATTVGEQGETAGLVVTDAAQAPRAEGEIPPEAWPLDRLMAAIDVYATRDLTVNDVTYAAFGELPRWVALPSADALDLAAAAFTPEEKP